MRQKQYDAVIAQTQPLLLSHSQSAILHYFRGLAYLSKNQPDQAVKSFQNSVRLNPDDIESWGNMGIAMLAAGNIAGAVNSHKKALSLNPKKPDIYLFNLGNAYQAAEDWGAAEASYGRALEFNSSNIAVLNNLGIVLKQRGKIDAAMAAYRKVTELKPDHLDAYLNGAEAYERSNKLDALATWMDGAKKQFGELPHELRVFDAWRLFRHHRVEDASIVLASIDADALRQKYRKRLFELQGKCAEKMRNFDHAFDCFTKLNGAMQSDASDMNIDADDFFEAQVKRRDLLRSLDYKRPLFEVQHTRIQPTFMVGFPRSGTTLLDTILRSHSHIEVVEERPAADTANLFLESQGDFDFVESFPKSTQLQTARLKYLEVFQAHVSKMAESHVHIDKFPLNMMHVGLLHHLFPDSKMILSVRHPLDVVISNWSQNFKLNPAMANMLDLQRIVDFYCVAMEAFRSTTEMYGVEVHTVRYENLVQEMKTELESLLGFLGLEWQDELSEYQSTARERGKINTPSYAQVVQPLYTDSMFRWQYYHRHLKPYLEQIAPWVSELGYDPIE